VDERPVGSLLIVGESFEVATGAVGELFWRIEEGALVGRPGQIVAWNPGAEAITGMTAAEATADGAELRRAFGDATDQLWALIEAGSGRARLECTGGNERVLRATAWRLGGQAASPTVIIFRDVTTDERLVDGLRDLNAVARELLSEPSLDSLLARIVDAAKDLARADFSALLLLREGHDYEVSRFAYNAPRELFPERLPRAVGLLAVPMESREVTRIDDIRSHPAGVGIPVEHPPIAALLAAPVLLSGTVVGELAVANRPGRPSFDDVEEAMICELASHAALAVSLTSGRAAEEHSRSARRALTDVALHNLRTPLTVARGFLSTLQTYGEDLQASDRDDAFQAIDEALHRIQDLAEGALLQEPTAAGLSPPVTPERIELTSLLEELKASLEHYREDVGLDLRMENGCCGAFTGDRRLVRESLENLITNALQHSPSREVVKVTARLEGGSVRFDVTDRGPGIPPEEQGRVFDQFYRTRLSTAEGHSGTGVGLWIVRQLAELQGGGVGVTSRSGQGATFWVTFPLVAAEQAAPPRPG
jgi:signal transduction histidine kinase